MTVLGPPSTLPRRAEAALERLGDHRSLCYEGRWQRSGELALRARRAAAGFVALALVLAQSVVSLDRAVDGSGLGVLGSSHMGEDA